MPVFNRYRRPAPAGSIIVRLMQVGGETVGFLRQVEDIDEDEAPYPTEQVPAEEALQLAEGKREMNPDVQIFIDLEPGAEWDPSWGEIRE